LKSALFVDFDNVYSGLRKLDQSIADRFARQPLAWMNWLIDSLELPDHVPDGARRRVLVRRCYLNPQAYQRFRASFNLAGFEIIDCPALTSEGKTSTDIHMVLDIIDLLQHETRYDEFIVFSADADFTPVLRKLRRSDRRTTVLAIGFPSAAYRASADLLIDQDEFVRNALSFRDDGESAPPEPAQAPVVAHASEHELTNAALAVVQRTVAESAAPVPLSKLSAVILATVDKMDASTWAGFGSFRGLIDSWNLAPLRVMWEGGGCLLDPRRHIAPVSPAAAPAVTIDNSLDSITAAIQQEVAKANLPVPCSRVAALITAQHATVAADWNGKGSFRKFVEALSIAPLKCDWSASGGRIYDPLRHTLASANDSRPTPANGSMPDWGAERDLVPIATQINEITSTPLLRPQDYLAIFKAIESDLAEHSFDLKETGKRVRDRSRDSGHLVSRLDVNWILRGLLMRGHKFGAGDDDALSLSRKTANNVRSLCLREQMVLDKVTDHSITRWIG
jgi:hypothetical protein